MILRIITVPDIEEHLNNPSEFKTSQALFDRGICVCSSCGKIHSVDYRFCKNCNIEIVIVIEK
jgi:hypothetical protein